MNERKKFALGILLGLVVLTLVAFVPSLTDFNSGQFNTDNRTVTIGAAVPLTNASLRSSAAYQKDINSLAFSVSVYNTSTITNVEEWRSIPYPAGSPNVLGNVDLNGNLFMSGNGNFGSGAAAGTPSAIRLIDSTTGKYWQWSELNAASNIIERLPTNGNNGLSWGIKMWTNVAVAADGTPTNQAMNFQLGTGLSVDWANRLITSSASGVSQYAPYTNYSIPFYLPEVGMVLSSKLIGDEYIAYAAALTAEGGSFDAAGGATVTMQPVSMQGTYFGRQGFIRFNVYGTNGIGGTHYARVFYRPSSFNWLAATNQIMSWDYAFENAATNQVLQMGLLSSANSTNQTAGGIYFQADPQLVTNLVFICVGSATTNYTSNIPCNALNTFHKATWRLDTNGIVASIDKVPFATNNNTATWPVGTALYPEAIVCNGLQISNRFDTILDSMDWRLY